jgi:hypothetical protein
LLLIAARRRAVTPHPSLSLDLRRSFAVTDQAILDGFSFERVVNAIVERSGTRTTALRLCQQMFDTQNPKPGLAVADAPHCDDFLVDDKPGFNGLPRRCPTPEGILATTNPFAGTVYMPLALINRFDLASAGGSNCGQYRMIFAKKTATPGERIHFIFEAVLPNPVPTSGIEGCRGVAQFWADLSKIDSISERRARLENFFFTGIAGFEPVIDADHYSLASGGGIRSLHGTRAGLGGNRFYQFRLAKRGDELIVEPDVLDNMPFGRFFDATYDTAAARGFRDAFIQNVRNLAIRDVNLYFMNIPREFLMAESDPVDGEFQFIYGTPFIHSQVTPEGREFAGRITEELRKVGSTLSTTEVITRAETLNCVGCHFIAGNVGEGVVFPQPVDQFQHVSEQHIESGEAGSRFAISPAMRDVFIPHRMEILRRFLTAGTPPVHSNGSGRRTE